MINLKCFLVFAIIFATPVLLNANQEQVKVNMFSEVSSVSPGDSIRIAIQFDLESSWHIYWQNPGESGMGTYVKWNLPKGVRLESFRQPIPEIFYTDDMVSFGYQKSALFIAHLLISDQIDKSQDIEIMADIHWLACKDICIAGQAQKSVTLPVSKRTFDLKAKEKIDNARFRFAQGEIVSLEVKRNQNVYSIQGKAPRELKDNMAPAYFFPSKSEGGIPRVQKNVLDNRIFEIQFSIEDRIETVDTLEGILTFRNEKEVKGYWINQRIKEG